MAFGLGSRRSNRCIMVLYAVAAVCWSAWRLFEYRSSDVVRVLVEPIRETPPVELFGGVVQPGDAVELSVEKSDVQRLGGMIDFFQYSEIIVSMVLMLVGIAFLYRFCDRVIDNRAFGRGATVDVSVLAGCIVLFFLVGQMAHTMTTNSVINALGMLDVIDTARNSQLVWIALGVAAFLQYVSAAVTQGAKLAEDTEGLV